MSQRMPKVNELLRSNIAQIIERELEFPNSLVTVTNVDCASDFGSANVWISILPANKTGSTIKQLRGKSNFVRSKLSALIRLRRLPELRFVIDDTEEHASEIEKIIAQF
ncbi:MAG: 30S ribosome-binding factor RbfA [bacterium]|nr:30S ribosome-binding factor RbfA [bacterium]